MRPIRPAHGEATPNPAPATPRTGRFRPAIGHVRDEAKVDRVSRGLSDSAARDDFMPHIEIRDVSLVYDTPAGQVTGIQSASFNIEQSEFLCIVGPSGCGKSTLLNIIAGFLSPASGEIRIGGKPVTGHGMDRGVVFQDFAQLFPWRTALGN